MCINPGLKSLGIISRRWYALEPLLVDGGETMFWTTLEFCTPLMETLFDRLPSTVAADNGICFKTSGRSKKGKRSEVWGHTRRHSVYRGLDSGEKGPTSMMQQGR